MRNTILVLSAALLSACADTGHVASMANVAPAPYVAPGQTPEQYNQRLSEDYRRDEAERTQEQIAESLRQIQNSMPWPNE